MPAFGAPKDGGPVWGGGSPPRRDGEPPAVDAFLGHRDLARSTRRVYRASLASLATQLCPRTVLGGLPVRRWPRGFARHAMAALASAVPSAGVA
jgi:hypothetical protein